MDTPSDSPGARPAPDGALREVAFCLLYGALAASAGHGLFLYARLTRHENLVPNWGFVRKMLGELGLATVAWFLAAIPLALAALLLRGPLLRSRLLWPLALVGAGGAALAYAGYARLMGLVG